MIEDLNPDNWLSVEQARNAFPGRPAYETIWRWMTRGIGPSRVKLASKLSGGRRYIHKTSISEFDAARNGMQPARVTTASAARDAKRRRENTNAILARFGVQGSSEVRIEEGDVR